MNPADVPRIKISDCWEQAHSLLQFVAISGFVYFFIYNRICDICMPYTYCEKTNPSVRTIPSRELCAL